MYLENHFRSDVLAFETSVDSYHCHFYDVGGSTLNRRVDGISLGETTHSAVGRVDVGKIAAAVE